jgi:hypothetical protein
MSDPIGNQAAGHVPDVHGTSTAVEGVHGSPDDHGDGHGHDDHAHASETLGPIDWTMWGVGILGVVLALAVVAGMVLATGFSFSA